MIGLFTTRSVLRYTLMPEVMGRLNALLFSGFFFIPYSLAVLYQMVRLLPSSHPYLDTKNIGRYGVRHVVAEAARQIN